MKIYGYFTVCIRVKVEWDEDGERKNSEAGMKYSSDFSRPLTEDLLENILEAFKSVAERLGFTVVEIGYCTEEEYQSIPNTEEYTFAFDTEEMISSTKEKGDMGLC